MSTPSPTFGQTALVTGASRGIGRAIAIALGSAGIEIVVNYSNSPEKAIEVVNEIKNSGGNAYALKADISQETDVHRLIEEVLNRSG